MTAVRIAVAMVGLNVVLNIGLVFGTDLGVAGLAWSTAICAIIQTFVLLRCLERRTERLLDVDVGRSVVETIVSSILMLVVVLVVLGLVSPVLPQDRWWSALVELTVATSVGAGVHLGLSRWRRRPELRWALGRSGGG